MVGLRASHLRVLCLSMVRRQWWFRRRSCYFTRETTCNTLHSLIEVGLRLQCPLVSNTPAAKMCQMPLQCPI